MILEGEIRYGEYWIPSIFELRFHWIFIVCDNQVSDFYNGFTISLLKGRFVYKYMTIDPIIVDLAI